MESHIHRLSNGVHFSYNLNQLSNFNQIYIKNILLLMISNFFHYILRKIDCEVHLYEHVDVSINLRDLILKKLNLTII